MNINKIKRKLLKYLKQNFELKSYGTHLKYWHTKRTAILSKQIAKSLNLTLEEQNLAYVLGLFHDFARFNQWTTYKSFDDDKTKDHADWAVELLFQKNMIKEFNIPEKYYPILKTATMEHNKFKISKNVIDEKTILFCKIIRDADKLDILNILLKQEIKLPNTTTGITQEVIETCKKNTLVDKKYVVTRLDFYLMTLALVYDLNFNFSYQKLQKMKYCKKVILQVKTLFNIDEQELLKEPINNILIFVQQKTKQIA